MKNLFNRAVLAILGLFLTLGYWNFTGGDSNRLQQSSIPTKVWAGGGGDLAIEVTSSVPGYLSISFNEHGDDGQSLETREEVSAGTHRWNIDVPHNAGGYIEFGAKDPEPGAQLSWTIKLNGDELESQNETLEQELKKNEAFFIQSYYEDYSQGSYDEEGL